MSCLLILSMIIGLQTTTTSPAALAISDINLHCRQIDKKPCEQINFSELNCSLDKNAFLDSAFNRQLLSLQLHQTSVNVEAKDKVLTAQNTRRLSDSYTWKMLQRQFPVR